jgi:Castor and Pollux, part of voltage-gated ion channel/Calcium-activated potassium channel slowpoke-like RCK domain
MGSLSWRQRLRYRFDTFMARGGASIFFSLTVIFLAIFVLLTIFRLGLFWLHPDAAIQHEERGLWGHIYITFLEMTDPGNMAQDITSSIWYKIFAVLSGLAGIILLSALIAFITTALDQKISRLKRGHSKIVESDHSLVLGWDSQRVVEIIRELIIANESEGDACVVVLSERDKEDMDDHLRLHLPDTKTTRLVTRSGNTASMINLDVVSVETCKSVVVLAECEDTSPPDQKMASDAKVIQTVLALTNMRREGDGPGIVAEIFSETNRDVITRSFPENIVTVNTSDILAKILVQTSRSVGLSVVYSEILSFDGCEMYFHRADWGDIAFRDLAFRFPDGVPMGIRHADGSLSLNPDVDSRLRPDDDILILADDDSTIDFQGAPVATPREIALAGGRLEQRVERELILGWTHKTPIILEQYADYVMPGSSIDIMIKSPSDRVRGEIEAATARLTDLTVRLIDRDRLSTEDLMAMEPFTYDNIIILADSGQDITEQQVDSENIVTLLLLRDIFSRHPEESQSTKLITEVLDSQNHILVAKAGVKDVIISNRLVSMMLAQVSENRDIKRVYDDLFEEDGSEIYLKPASLYLSEFPAEVTFADMIRIAQLRAEICLGVKIRALEESVDDNFGVQLIPEKTQAFTLQPDDCLIVLAEDES